MIYDFFMHFATGLCEYVFSRDTYYGYYGYGYGYYYAYCVTQLMLYTGDKLSSTIFCCL